jgi:hypothetical protein
MMTSLYSDKLQSPAVVLTTVGRRPPDAVVRVHAHNATMTFLVFVLLLVRCMLDTVFPGHKPVAGIAVFLLLTAIIIVGTRRILASSLILILGCIASVLPSMVTAPIAVLGQIDFAAQCLIPIILLLALSRSRIIDFDKLRKLFLRYGIPLCFALAFYSLAQQTLQETLEYFDTNPTHTTAQLLAKACLLFIDGTTLGPLFAMATLVAFNVRSSLLGYVLGVATGSRRMFIVLCVVVLVFLLLAVFQPGPFEDFVQRLLFKNRGFLGDSMSNMSSGRTDKIWPYYVSFLSRSTPSELLFGHGAVWLFSRMRLFGHNDFLTIFVTYGAAGILIMSSAWYVILSRISSPYKYACISLFVVLALTNGVVSYQSNILFVLFFGVDTQAVRIERRNTWAKLLLRGRPRSAVT